MEKVDLSHGVFALEQVYETKPRAEGFFESHRKYIDVQFVFEGDQLRVNAECGIGAIRVAFERESCDHLDQCRCGGGADRRSRPTAGCRGGRREGGEVVGFGVAEGFPGEGVEFGGGVVDAEADAAAGGLAAGFGPGGP